MEQVKDSGTPKSVIELSDVSLYNTRGLVGRRHRPGVDDELVLSGVNLSVAPGEIVYLIGRVGSGKSTLLKTLYGEVPLFEGSGRVVDHDLRRLRRRDIPFLRRKIGVVFQDYQLLTDRNVMDNLHYVAKATGWKGESDIRRRIEEVLHMAGLKNKEYKMPFQLSGGEQQRLAIARALLNSPRVILADEPTGNLDPAAADGIMALFRRIADDGTAIVMSTHNIGNIQVCPSRTLRFSAGQVREIDIRPILGISEEKC
jgi:cell division transport system ATP-binding protein